MHKRQTSGVDLLSTSTKRPAIISSAEREVKDSCSSGMFQSCNFGTSECLEATSALVRVQFFWRLPSPPSYLGVWMNELVRELKVDERKLLTQSKTLCLNRRHQFVQSEDYTSYMEKRFAKGMCITLKSEGIWTIEEDCSKSNSKEKEVQSFVLCVDQPIDCQQEEEEHSYRRFVKVVIGIIILALLLVLFAKVGVLTLTFVLRVTVFHVIIYFAVLYMNYHQCGDCALSASFVKECSDVSYVAGERVELTVHKETVVVEEIKEVELRSRYAQFIYDGNDNRIHLQRRGHVPSRLPVKKLRRLLHKKREGRAFV